MTGFRLDGSPARQKTCAHCSTVFGCSTSVGCWCAVEPYRLPMPAPGSGGDCLCPACLRAEAARWQAM